MAAFKTAELDAHRQYLTDPEFHAEVEIYLGLNYTERPFLTPPLVFKIKEILDGNRSTS